MIWIVPKIWRGGECFIFGGGTSLTRQFDIPSEIVQKVTNKELEPSAYSPYMKAIHHKHCIAVNMAFKIGNWMDMVFFGDKRWFYNNRMELSKFQGIKVTCHPHLKDNKFKGDRIKYLARSNKKPRGISDVPSTVSWNKNSGAAAISVAAHMGVKRIVLLGFDMKLSDDNHQHWHGLYRNSNKYKDPRKLPFTRHLTGFPDIAKDAKRIGIEILNASDDSAITEFKKINIKDIL